MVRAAHEDSFMTLHPPNYAEHRQAMRETLARWVDSVAGFARRRGIPPSSAKAWWATPRS
jgi:hypothetical protein